MEIPYLFKSNKKNIFNPFIDNSNRIARIMYRLKAYRVLYFNIIKKGAYSKDLVLAQFPFLFKDRPEPPIISIEFTNYCNLKCPYCTSSQNLRKRGYMSDELFDKIVKEIDKMKPNRIQLVGNGESSIHPNFGMYIKRLAETDQYISLVTNGQWINKNTAEQILKAPIDLVEISIDAGGKEKYESSRINGKYEVLISNLVLLKELKQKLNAKTLINIRLMVRPSEKDKFQEEYNFWKQYCDTIMPQFLTKINNTEYDNDLFLPIQQENKAYPKCSMPFKHMEIKYTGEVLMCYYTFFQLGSPGLVIGNVSKTSITDLWNCKIMKDYREAHRKKIKSKMPACEGCPGI